MTVIRHPPQQIRGRSKRELLPLLSSRCARSHHFTVIAHRQQVLTRTELVDSELPGLKGYLDKLAIDGRRLRKNDQICFASGQSSPVVEKSKRELCRQFKIF